MGATRMQWRTGGLALAILFATIPSLPAADGFAEDQNGVNVLPRGPVHEAFAQPVARNADAPLVVPKRPPDPIPEEPPDQRPQAENVQWIPGYWAWDGERKDFVWLSGVWRVPPPEHQWMPGYWNRVTFGWQWVPGYWGVVNQQNPQFLPAPPQSVEEGPSAPAPNDNSIYVPGSWMFGGSGYAWRPGFWSPGHANWVWNAGYYSWTPAGYVYVNGFWDYTLAQRGLLFAPVAFNRPLWGTPGWVYRPTFAVGVDGLLGSLFVMPGATTYYFGNYYSPLYASLGFSPWYAYGRRNWDPLFTYYRWTNRNNAAWVDNLHSTFIARRDGAHVPNLATPIRQFRSDGLVLNQVSSTQLARDRREAERLRSLSASRSTLETSQPRQSFYRGPGSSDPSINPGTPRPSPGVTLGGSSGNVFQGGPSNNRPPVMQSGPPSRPSLPPPPTTKSGPSNSRGGGSSSGSHPKDGSKH